jgi:hypothetical protein
LNSGCIKFSKLWLKQNLRNIIEFRMDRKITGALKKALGVTLEENRVMPYNNDRAPSYE